MPFERGCYSTRWFIGLLGVPLAREAIMEGIETWVNLGIVDVSPDG